MTDATRDAIERDRRLWRWLGRLLIVAAAVVLVLSIVTVNRKADRVACIDDLEVAWRIDVGQGVSKLIRGEDSGLEASADNLDETTARLQEVKAGRRCVYRSPFHL